MFNGRKKKERMMEAINMIRPTSKAALKQASLYLCNFDIDKAGKMYDFLIKGMENIPDVEPETKPFIKNIGEQASGAIGWIRDNQDVLVQGATFIKGLFSKNAPASAAPLPPING